MRLFFLLCIIFISFSCVKDTSDSQKATNLNFSDINRVWKQSKPDSLKTYFQGSGTTTYFITDETYHLHADNSYNISGKIGLRSSDNGKYVWDEENQEVHFTPIVDSEIIIIGESGIEVPSSQKWKWDIVDYSNDSLTVYEIKYDHTNHRYREIGLLRTYIRN